MSCLINFDYNDSSSLTSLNVLNKKWFKNIILKKYT